MSYLFLVLILLLTIGMVEFLHSRNSVLNVSAVEATGNIGIYWDENCSKRADSIDWGVLSPSETKEVVVYVRNEGNESFFLALTPTNWSPVNASCYLNFSWSCENNAIEAGKVVKVTQILLVSPDIKEISNFSFNIIFEGIKYLIEDVNRDGFVDMRDVGIVCSLYGSTPQDPRWNPDADMNKDGKIDMRDVGIVCSAVGSTP